MIALAAIRAATLACQRFFRIVQMMKLAMPGGLNMAAMINLRMVSKSMGTSVWAVLAVRPIMDWLPFNWKRKAHPSFPPWENRLLAHTEPQTGLRQILFSQKGRMIGIAIVEMIRAMI